MRNNWQTFLCEIRSVFVAVYEMIFEIWGKANAINDIWFTARPGQARHLKEKYGRVCAVRCVRVWKAENT